MIGLVMCGGLGTRMKADGEKLLLRYKKPVIEHVICALVQSRRFSRIVCATSPNAPRTTEFVRGLGVEAVETSGRGYVEDLAQALANFREKVFVVSGDLVLLDSEVIGKILDRYRSTGHWTSVLVSKKFAEQAGSKPEFLVTYRGRICAYTGISIVNPEGISGTRGVRESYIVIDDRRVAINLNTREDCDLLGAA